MNLSEFFHRTLRFSTQAFVLSTTHLYGFESGIVFVFTLIEILQKVGLWEIFAVKEGLETLIGEGGLNLSGGQRQRLNFAGLYLRAKYFEPSLILIDEPTSSLDEVSEHAVTKMILELAKDSLTFVIAHRLKTLDKASGILDFSLNTGEKQMKFYTASELANHSNYYQKLIKGEVELDG